MSRIFYCMWKNCPLSVIGAPPEPWCEECKTETTWRTERWPKRWELSKKDQALLHAIGIDPEIDDERLRQRP